MHTDSYGSHETAGLDGSKYFVFFFIDDSTNRAQVDQAVDGSHKSIVLNGETLESACYLEEHGDSRQLQQTEVELAMCNNSC